LLNLIVTPYYTGLPLSSVTVMIPTVLLPFNLIKMFLNAVIAFILLQALRKPLNI
jgi:riboflavin transporter FmnP